MHSRQPTPMVESLTPREQEVLGLIAEGLTNREICQRLHLELSTIKSHNNQIFGKLSVNNRREAVVRGRILGLVDVGVLDLPKNNLPAQTTPFIGRESELAELTQRLADPNLRLITVLAPGGMGKTRLALELADRIVESVGAIRESPLQGYANGVFFVSLAPVHVPDYIVSAIAEAAGFQFMQDKRNPKQQVLDFLSNKQMLLILDNFEHLLDGAGIATDILEAAPGVTVLATSRERLNLRSETVFSITGMDCGEAIETCDALALFEQSARQVRADFVLSEDNHEAVTTICDLVEGMPLAIILAAAWVEVLSLEEIAEEIARSVDFLTAEMRDVPRRQWSIRAVFEPTWNRLTETEQDAFMRFSVFRGGATLSAAQTVTGADLRTLQSLVNKALIWRGPGGRYEMHELFRQFAESKLEEMGEAESVRDAHSTYYLTALAEREADLKGRDQLGALNDIESDFENVRLAWFWAAEQQNAELIASALTSLEIFVEIRGDWRKDNRLVHQAFEAFAPEQNGEPSLLWARLRAAKIDFSAGGHPGTKSELESCLVVAEKFHNKAVIVEILGSLSFVQDDPEERLRLKKTVLEHYRALEDDFNIARWLGAIGWFHAYNGDHDQAIEYCQHSIDLSRKNGDDINLTQNLIRILPAAGFSGRYEVVESCVRESLPILRRIGFQNYIAGGSILASWLEFLANGDFDRARAYASDALEVALDIHYPNYQGGALGELGWVVCMEGDYAQGKQYCDEGQLYAGGPFTQWCVDLCGAIANCGLGDYPEAARYLKAALQIAEEVRGLGFMEMALPVAPVIFAYQGQTDRAVELLGPVFSRPVSETGWMNKWPVLTQLRADLKTELGEDAYNAAWERGCQLDLETVVQELMAE